MLSARLTPLFFVALSGLAALARADDPTAPRAVFVGPPAGASPVHRIDGARSGRSRVAFPQSPHVGRRVRLTADVSGPFATDEAGRAVVATTDRRLTQLSADLRVEWSLELDGVAPGVVLTSARTRVAVTDAGTVWGVSDRGRPLFTTRRPDAVEGRQVPALATRDGSVLVAAGASVVRIDRDGSVGAETRLDAKVSALGEAGDTVLVTTETGAVLSFRPPHPPEPRGSLGSRPAGDVAVTRNGVAAVTPQGTVVELDFARGTRRSYSAPERFLPAVAVDADGLLALGTGGHLFALGGGVEPSPLAAVPLPAGARPPADTPLTPPLIDPGRAIAFLGPGARIHVVLPSGEVRGADLPGCGVPIQLAPAAPARLLVACASGLVLEITDPPVPVPAERGQTRRSAVGLLPDSS